MAEANVIQCPNCRQAYFVQPHQWAQYQGQTINCTRCGKPFTVAPSALAQAPGMPGAGDGSSGAFSAATEQSGLAMGMSPQVAAAPPQPPVLPPGFAPAQFQPGGYPPPAYGQYGGMMYPPPAARTSGLAIASLILGILSFCVPVLGSLAAVGTGIGGLVGTRDRRAGGRGLAVAGLALGLFTLVIETPLMLAVIIPAANKGIEAANRVQCEANLKGLGAGLMSYAETHEGKYPAELDDVLQVASPPEVSMFKCPSDDKTAPASSPPESTAADINSGKHCSYVYVGSGVKTSADPQTVILYEPLGNHHREGMNALFADGHTRWLGAEEAQKILDQRAKGTRPIRVNTP
jgi:predicted Zn finger-like uncharacterized protein/prepilin-type processing-associated H-X9-DG protein